MCVVLTWLMPPHSLECAHSASDNMIYRTLTGDHTNRACSLIDCITIMPFFWGKIRTLTRNETTIHADNSPMMRLFAGCKGAGGLLEQKEEDLLSSIVCCLWQNIRITRFRPHPIQSRRKHTHIISRRNWWEIIYESPTNPAKYIHVLLTLGNLCLHCIASQSNTCCHKLQ